LLGFSWIPLAESGLFNGLQRIQIKKFFLLAIRVSGCASPHRVARSESWFRSAESIQRIPVVAKILSPVIDSESKNITYYQFVDREIEDSTLTSSPRSRDGRYFDVDADDIPHGAVGRVSAIVHTPRSARSASPCLPPTHAPY
jgi:hypothetical protein